MYERAEKSRDEAKSKVEKLDQKIRDKINYYRSFVYLNTISLLKDSGKAHAKTLISKLSGIRNSIQQKKQELETLNQSGGNEYKDVEAKCAKSSTSFKEYKKSLGKPS